MKILVDLYRNRISFQSLENLWAKERSLYVEQIENLEQSLIEAKKLSIEQQTKIMQMEIQFETQEGQIDAQVELRPLRPEFFQSSLFLLFLPSFN